MIYVHVPFCRSFCIYCGFYSEIAPEGRDACMFGEYSRAVREEIAARKDEITDMPNTLYIGGGTPSVPPLSVLSGVTEALADAGHGGPYDEFTVEANPEDIVEKGSGYVAGLRGLGVNRVSVGVQSFDDGILKWMNRRHTAGTAMSAVRMIQDAGIENISIDLIFGIPGLGGDTWADTVETALSLGVRHISAYQLSVEEGSALEDMISDGRCAEASEESCRSQYMLLCDRLARAGFRHYEISNFAVRGFEAVHNSAYWRRVPYVGFGPGAHSFDGRVRSWNAASLDGYGRESEKLSSEDERIENIMLSLRTDEGIGESFLRSLCDAETVDRLVAGKSLVRTGDRLRIPEERFFVSDGIVKELI